MERKLPRPDDSGSRHPGDTKHGCDGARSAHPTWDGIEPRLAAAGAVRVNDLEHDAPFRYLRFRDPPYTDAELAEWAERIAASDAPVYAYFRHEEEPTAPRYAQRLLELLV